MARLAENRVDHPARQAAASTLPHAGALAFDTGNRDQVRLRLRGEDHVNVLRDTSTRGRVEGLRESAAVHQDLGGGLLDGAVRQRMFDLEPPVDLTSRGRTQVVAFVLEAAEVAERIGAGGHRLGLQGIELGIEVGAHLERYHTAQVLLHLEHVHDVESAAIVEEDPQLTAVARAIERQARGACFESHPTSRNPTISFGRPQQQGGFRTQSTFDDDPRPTEAPVAEARPKALGLFPGVEAPDPHPIQADAAVERGGRRRRRGRRQGLGETLRLVGILESGDLEPVDRSLGRRRRQDLDATGGGERLSVEQDPRFLDTTGERKGLEVGGQPHSQRTVETRRAGLCGRSRCEQQQRGQQAATGASAGRTSAGTPADGQHGELRSRVDERASRAGSLRPDPSGPREPFRAADSRASSES